MTYYLSTSAVDSRYLTAGRVNVHNTSPEKIAQILFGASRDTDTTTHFDPDVHTLEAIAAGLPGHVALSCREVAEEDLPYSLSGVCTCGHCDESTNNDPEHGECVNANCHDRYFRNACEDTGKEVVVNMDKARAIKLAKIGLQGTPS